MIKQKPKIDLMIKIISRLNRNVEIIFNDYEPNIVAEHLTYLHENDFLSHNKVTKKGLDFLKFTEKLKALKIK